MKLTGNGETGRVVTIDIKKELAPAVRLRSDISFILGDSKSLSTVAEVSSLIPPAEERKGTLFISLDSDHSSDHVLWELKGYVPMMKKGDILVVEDTMYDKYNARRGPLKALRKFTDKNQQLVPIEGQEEYFGFTCNAGGVFMMV